MALSLIQEQLQHIYGLDLNHSVNDYLITSREIAESQFQTAINSRESLLIYQDDDELYLSLYLQEEILENLMNHDEELILHRGNLQDFCLALEGISHFVYLTWNASFRRCVTRLEMEIQAEVDKFIILSEYFSPSHVAAEPGALRKTLFETVRYRGGLTEQESQRYRDANFYADKYCWLLESRNFLNGGLEPELLRELRRFYRLGLRDKLNRIRNFH